MRVIASADLPALRPWFAPERPGPLIFEHVARTGHGRCRADRWPDPRVVVAELPGGNVALRGDPEHLPDGALDDLAGFVDAPAHWLPALRDTDPAVAVWDRIVATLPPAAAAGPTDGAADWATVIGPDDAAALAAFEPDGAWIHETWGGAEPLAAARVARGRYVEGRLVSVAVPFYVGGTYEDIGVVTDSGHRGRGYSGACTAALVADVRARGHVPSWTTSPDNAASLAVAARAGFTTVRTDVLYAVRVPIPPGTH